MPVHSVYIDKGSQFVQVEPPRVAQLLEERAGSVWVDLQYTETDQIEEWLDTLGVTGLARGLCLEGIDRAGFYPLKNEIFLVIPFMAGGGDPDAATEVDHVALYCRDDLVFTVHQGRMQQSDQLSMLRASDDWLPERTLPGVVAASLMKMSLDCLNLTTKLRDAILALEDRIDHDPDSVEVEEILDVRAELLPLGAVVEGQLPSITALSTTKRSFFKLGETRDYVNCAKVNLQAAELSLTWLDQRISSLRSSFQMHAQDKTNRRLGVLTILSAIFMPMTLVAGIWGMNFELMPELAWPYAYPAALVLIVSIGIGMYLFFSKTGWFD